MTRTARTRATWSSPPRRSRPKRSTSWCATAAASSACRMSPEICDRLDLEPLPGRNVDAAGDAVDAAHRRPHRHHHRHLRLRPRPHHPGRHRRPHRPPPTWSSARATCPACGPAKGGVLVRAGHTEGSVDLARLAGLKEAAVICEIMTPDGTHGPPARPAATSAGSTA